MLYAPAPVVFAYYSNLGRTNIHNNLLFRVAFTEHSVFFLMSFVESAFCGELCIASGNFHGIEDLCRGRILVPLSKGALDFVQTVGFFEVARSCAFGIPQVCLAFHRMVHGDWESDGSVC